jgi:hypothetical protein
MAVYNLGFYNLEESRPAFQTHPEITAIVTGGAVGGPTGAFVPSGPLDAFGMSELVGNTCPVVPGYRRIRSHETPGRTNLGCYVRRELYAGHRWVQQTLTWTRPRHPDAPRHPARAILVVDLVDGTQLVVDHFPERPSGPRPDELVAARAEYEKDLVAILAPWTQPDFADRTPAQQDAARARARIVLGDQNASPTDPMLQAIAEQADLTWHGQGVDLAATHNAELVELAYFHQVEGVTRQSDHRHHLATRIRVQPVS